MKFEEIERLVRLVAETGLAEVEVTRSGVSVRVTRQLRPDGVPAVHLVPFMSSGGGGSWPQPSGAAPPPALGSAQPGGAPAAPAEEAGLHYLTASMVGTFYRRSNPEAPPFVKEGDVVKKGQVVCILEAMKILNEIESDVSGTVVQVFVEDSQPVEFGERLMSVRPL